MTDPLKQEIHDKLAEILNRCGNNPDKLNAEHTARLDALVNRLASTDLESAKELLLIAGLTHLELLIRTQ